MKQKESKIQKKKLNSICDRVKIIRFLFQPQDVRVLVALFYFISPWDSHREWNIPGMQRDILSLQIEVI